MELIIYLLIGAIAGFTAGLFGVGGGLIIVPILYIVFTQLQYDPSVIMHMAVGTSLATIIVTSISSVMAHHQRGAVLWSVFRNLAPGLIIGSFLGAGIADYLSGQGLQLLIGFFAVWVAFKMFKGANVQVDPNKKLPSTPVQLAVGGGIGVASAIFGIGGGSLTVPFLNRCGIVMQKAVATSAACGLPIADCRGRRTRLYLVWSTGPGHSTKYDWLYPYLCLYWHQYDEFFYRQTRCKSGTFTFTCGTEKMFCGFTDHRRPVFYLSRFYGLI